MPYQLCADWSGALRIIVITNQTWITSDSKMKILCMEVKEGVHDQVHCVLFIDQGKVAIF